MAACAGLGIVLPKTLAADLAPPGVRTQVGGEEVAGGGAWSRQEVPAWSTRCFLCFP